MGSPDSIAGQADKAPIRVALFVSCLADSFRPGVAAASVSLLQRAGCDVVVPRAQTCCGQPGYNGGDRSGAAASARAVIRSFETFPHVVLPSGSCAGMLKHHYPRLLDGAWRARAEALAGRVHELTSFLDGVLGWTPPRSETAQEFAYHDSCAGLRELGIRDQPRRLLEAAGHRVRDIEGSEVCCGFGGTFCARMPSISARMSDDKLAAAQRSGADTLLGGDLGCLLSLAGRARRRDLPLRFRHVAEVLAEDMDAPAIGEGGA
ncbi:MAG: (Fe-S)-binding protein [Halieaceae bacterium]|jgi:L-lactate dehydrogenase complex protein LldE|nr:(Fe-S)-binding protein [Halieaceae bacterium]